jgi:hypothetical protein
MFFFGEIFLRILVLLFLLLIKLVPGTIRSKKKIGFIFHPSFYVPEQKDPGSGAFLPQGSGMKNLGIRIRDKTSRIRNAGASQKQRNSADIPSSTSSDPDPVLLHFLFHLRHKFYNLSSAGYGSTMILEHDTTRV